MRAFLLNLFGGLLVRKWHGFLIDPFGLGGGRGTTVALELLERRGEQTRLIKQEVSPWREGTLFRLILRGFMAVALHC